MTTGTGPDAITVKISLGDWAKIVAAMVGIVAAPTLWILRQGTINELQDQRLAAVEKQVSAIPDKLERLHSDIARLSESVNKLIGKLEK